MPAEIQVRGLDHFAQRMEPSQGGDIGFGVNVVSWDGTQSFQAIWADFQPAATFGSSTNATPAYGAAVMGNITGSAAVAATDNILAGVIGKCSLSGTISATYPMAGLIGEIEDAGGNTRGYSVLAVHGGDPETTSTPVAYFGVDRQNTRIASIPDYGLDLQGIGSHDGYNAVAVGTADIRLVSGGLIVSFDTAITANSTETTLAAGTLGKTTHSTGRASLFVSDGSKFQFLTNS